MASRLVRLLAADGLGHVEGVDLLHVLAERAGVAAPGHHQVPAQVASDALLLSNLLPADGATDTVSDWDEGKNTADDARVSDLLRDLALHVAGTEDDATAVLAVAAAVAQAVGVFA